MGIPINSHCIDCLLKKHLEAARTLGDEKTAMDFGKAVMSLFLSAEPEDSSAVLGARINRLYSQFYGISPDRFREEKIQSNRFVLDWLPTIRQKIQQARDPVLTGLQYAIMGNYIDFSALGKSVSFDALGKMLEQPEKFPIDPDAYGDFCHDLSRANSLLYLTDNAGELGFDWALADALKEKYPHLEITFCVRGKPAYNDATREDYTLMGIPYPVIDNGTDIGGTDLSTVNQQTLDTLSQADIVIAKGMGNTETLYGSDYPIYFAFLVKCLRFQQVFQAPFMQPVFIRQAKK